jgi:hypothetical protein
LDLDLFLGNLEDLEDRDLVALPASSWALVPLPRQNFDAFSFFEEFGPGLGYVS